MHVSESSQVGGVAVVRRWEGMLDGGGGKVTPGQAGQQRGEGQVCEK